MSASGRNNRPCKVCKKNFEDCPHSLADESVKIADDHIREIVRDELKRQGITGTGIKPHQIGAPS